MFRIIVFLIVSIIFAHHSYAQWSRDIERDGLPPESVIEECEDAAHCIRLSEENLNDRDYQEAKIYMENAAKMKNAHAQYRLSEMHEDQISSRVQSQRWGANGDPRYDVDVFSPRARSHYGPAYYWIKIAELNGYPSANIKSDELWAKISDNWYYSKEEEVAEKEERLNEFEAGTLEGIGTTYVEGIYLTQDYKIAMHYFKEAEALNSYYGKLEIAKLYQYGRGVTKDYQKAREKYEELFEIIPDHTEANYQYALMLENGLGGPIDIFGAYKALARCSIHKQSIRDYLKNLKNQLSEDDIEEALRQVADEESNY